MKLLLLITALSFASGAGNAEQIYKSTDSQGRVVYSDRPPAGKAEIVAIESAPRVDAAARSRAERELEDMSAREQQRKRATLAKEAQKKAAADAATRKEERCVAARNLYLSLMEHSRVYSRDKEGQRVYYTGPQLDAEREKSKQRMDEECK